MEINTFLLEIFADGQKNSVSSLGFPLMMSAFLQGFVVSSFSGHSRHDLAHALDGLHRGRKITIAIIEEVFSPFFTYRNYEGDIYRDLLEKDYQLWVKVN